MKRLLAFLVLIGLGVLALRFAIGDEDAVRANGNEATKKQERQPTSPGGVNVQKGRIGASVTQSGPLEMPRWREVPVGDGSFRKEEIFVLVAEDSNPIGEGLQQLLRVTLKLFDDGKHAATLTANEAFVELGRDTNGRPAIDEQKTIDLREAVITAEPGSRMAGLRLELGDAKVNVLENEIVLTTTPEQPVKLVIAGDRPATLTGNGAQARLPRNRKGGLRKADVTILSDPVLETDDLRVEASGRMHYVEDTVTGNAKITLDDDVLLDLTRFGLALPGLPADPGGTAANSAVRGDQFTGWLTRSQKDNKATDQNRIGAGRSMAWQRLVLVGAPATVDVRGIHVETPRLTVLPGPLGEPFVITAHGGESRIVQTELRADSKQTDPVTGVSPRRIHLIRPGDMTGALHRNMGFPRWTMRSLDQQQIVVFEGASRLESGTRTVEASKGLLVVRRQSGNTGVVQGFGDIEVLQRGEKQPGEKQQPDMVAHGNNGLLLIVGEELERMRLGPHKDAPGWREHRYDVVYGDAKLRGLGTCTVERVGERTRLAMAAPFDEVEADFLGEGTELRNIRQLHAVLDGQRLEELDVGGLPARATTIRAGERVLAQAPRILQIGPRSMRLLPMRVDEPPWSELAEIDRTPRLLRNWTETGEEATQQTIEVLGPCIDVHHAGGRNVIVDATAVDEELPRIYASLPQPGSADSTTVTCAAERIRILPFVLPPEVRRFHLGGLASPIADLTFHSTAKPWLIVDRVRDFQLDDARQGHIEGTGQRLFVSQGGAAALFVGDPDALTPAVVRRTQNGRTVAMEGARVRVYRDEADRLTALGSFDDRSTFLAPTMTLHEPGASGLLSHMRAICRGNIQVDPDAIRFGGPVVAHGLTESGDDDPEGVQIDAEQLAMERLAATGEVVMVTGKIVDVGWSGMQARAAEVDLDLRRSRCVARDVTGAEVDLPDGRELRSPRIEVNYDTWSVSMGRGRIRQRAKGKDAEGQVSKQ